MPVNYRHVHLNEALIDWIFPGSNYDQVVTAAADEAGGQAFVTDFAGSSEIMDRLVYPEGGYDIDGLREIEAAELIDSLLIQGFPRDNQMRAILRRHLPMSQRVLEEGVLQVMFNGDQAAYDQAAKNGWLLPDAEAWFYGGSMSAFAEYIEEDEYDLKALLDELEAVVVEPLRAAQELFDEYPYLTRLYTTLSAEEMTLDPMFDFNPDLPEVPRWRRAAGSIDCNLADGQPEYEWTEWTLVLELADGRAGGPHPALGGFAPGHAGRGADRATGHLGTPRGHPAANPRGGSRFLKRTSPLLSAEELPEPLQFGNGHSLHHLRPRREAGGGNPAHLQCPGAAGAHGVEGQGGGGTCPGELGRSG